jgi:hypothetical protein
MKMKIDKKKFNEQLEHFYSDRKRKKYYSTEEIKALSGISERTLRYRLKELAKRYEAVPSLLLKKNRKWQIHYTVVDEFMPKYEPRTYTLSNYPWKSFITWCMVDDFDEQYHLYLIMEVEKALPENAFYFTIEKTKKNVNHVHMISDAESETIKNKVTEILNQYLQPIHYRLLVENIINRSQIISYLKK